MPIDSMISIADRQFMAEAIQLARQGLNTVTPNPRVGCVLAKDGVVVGRGWHQKAGQAHAEVNAIANAGDQAHGATAYITLEPCSFVGKTAACCDALQTAGIVRVVSAMQDPNPKVSGSGHKALQAAGIEVVCGLMSDEAAALNPGFIKRMQQQLPFVTGKMAMSLDGRAAMASGESQWITGPAARRQVQQLRARSCAIVTGVGTVIKDNPQLTVREQELGDKVTRQPALVIVDSHLSTPLDAAVVDEKMLAQRPVLIACLSTANADRKQRLLQRGVQLVELSADSNQDNPRVDLTELLRYLAAQQFNDILLEAGPVLTGSFIQHQLLDDLKLFVAPKLMGADAMPVLGLHFAKMHEALDITINDITAIGSDWLFSCSFNESP